MVFFDNVGISDFSFMYDGLPAVRSKACIK